MLLETNKQTKQKTEQQEQDNQTHNYFFIPTITLYLFSYTLPLNNNQK